MIFFFSKICISLILIGIRIYDEFFLFQTIFDGNNNANIPSKNIKMPYIAIKRVRVQKSHREKVTFIW